MRIVVTKDGTKIIEDLSIDNKTINQNSENNQADINMIKLRIQNLKKNKSENHIVNLKNINKVKSQSVSNLNNIGKTIDINDMLNNVITNKNKHNTNNKNKSNNKYNTHNLKIIKLKNIKKIKLPKLLENRYILYDNVNDESKNKNNIPDILLSINNSIENDNHNENIIKKNIKRTKTVSNINTVNDVNNIEKSENKIIINNDDNLPKIRKTFPLKYIIDKDSYNRLNKEMKSIEDNVNIEKKLFPKNYFIKNNWENSKKNFDISLKNEINSKHINLIEYLNKDKNISNIFIQKFCNLNKEEINKLDAISKKLLYKKKQDIQFNENIKNKIKANIMNININFRQSLNNMNNKLNKYELILNKGKDKNIFNDKNDKNRYLEQFMDAEKNWDKYNLERLYKKSSSPRRSLFRPLQE